MKRITSLVLLLFLAFVSSSAAAEGKGALLPVFSLLLQAGNTVVSSPDSYPLTVQTNGHGTVNKQPNSALYPEGTQVVLTAQPAPGYLFDHWSGGCSGSGTCTVTMDGPVTVTATFAPIPTNTYPLTVQTTGNGTVHRQPDLSAYPEGSQVVLTADPDPGYTLDHWSGGGCSGSGTCTVTMNGPVTVTATFTLIPENEYALTIQTLGSGTGDVDKSPDLPSYPAGSQVELTATAAPGSIFAGWSGAGCSGTEPTCTVIMDQAYTVTATFNSTIAPTDAYLYVVREGAGRILSNDGEINCGYHCSKQYGIGDSVTLEAVEGEFSEWQLDTGGGAYVFLSNSNPLTVNVDEEKRIKAVFTQLPVVVESELNNDRTTYNAIALDTVVQGELSVVNDEDWFRLSNSTARTVTVRFQATPTNTDPHWRIRVLRYRWTFDDLLTEVEVGVQDNFNVDLPTDGLAYYYFVVTSDGDSESFDPRNPYELIIATNPTADPAESETNNNSSEADDLAFDTTIHGSIMSLNDQDWFRVRTSIDRTVTVSFTGDSRMDSDERDWLVTVYKADGNTIISRIEVKDGDDFNVALPASGGDTAYYFAVSEAVDVPGGDTLYNAGPYTLTIASNDGVLTPAAELEANNNVATATYVGTFAGALDMTGQLMTESDQDWFVFETTGSQAVQVTAVFSPQVTGTHWRIFLYKEGDYTNYLNTVGTGWMETYGTSYQAPFTVTLPTAGRYYFKVLFEMDTYIRDYSSAQYMISVD